MDGGLHVDLEVCMDEIVVNASLDPKALKALSAKFERLSAIFSEANALLHELASSELKLTLETDD